MQVRAACLEDAGRIAEIHVRSWQHGYRGLIPQDYLDRLDPGQRLAGRIWHLEHADWSRGGCFLVTGEDGAPAGFADCGPSRDDDSDPDTVGEVMAIYLTPDAWGTGRGRVLMSAALRHLAQAGYAQVTLWVLDTNARAQRSTKPPGSPRTARSRLTTPAGSPLRELRYRRSLAVRPGRGRCLVSPARQITRP